MNYYFKCGIVTLHVDDVVYVVIFQLQCWHACYMLHVTFCGLSLIGYKLVTDKPNLYANLLSVLVLDFSAV